MAISESKSKYGNWKYFVSTARAKCDYLQTHQQNSLVYVLLAAHPNQWTNQGDILHKKTENGPMSKHNACSNYSKHMQLIYRQVHHFTVGWLRGTRVERWSLTGELSLSCTRPVADG